jgi:hypothetical protein
VSQSNQAEPRDYLSICAIYRDEAPYLREWVEFHRLVGVDRFYLYDNDSRDAHREALAPYVEAGVVLLEDWPVFPGQVPAYEECLRRRRDASSWIAFIDLDEFLFSPTGRKVSDVLAGYEEFPGVVVNWAVFGTSGHETRPQGLVIENYVERSDAWGYNRHLKSVVDPRRVANFCGPHFFTYRDGRAVDENRRPVDVPRAFSNSVSFSTLRINHYMTKSQEEYMQKVVAPAADGPRIRPGRKSERALARRTGKMNEVRDETIQMYLPELRKALAEVDARAPVIGPG